jgi:hypothetical protein
MKKLLLITALALSPALSAKTPETNTGKCMKAVGYILTDAAWGTLLGFIWDWNHDRAHNIANRSIINPFGVNGIPKTQIGAVVGLLLGMVSAGNELNKADTGFLPEAPTKKE